MTHAAAPTIPLRVALGEYDTGWHDPSLSLARAAEVVDRAANAGARLVVLPEMCTTGFTMESARWAEPADGSAVRELAALASTHQLWIIAGVALRVGDAGEQPHNTAMIFAPTGKVAGIYRKQRLFAFAGEHRSYSPGEGPLVLDIDGVRVSPFVCYDLRFPELFRRVAMDVDLIVIIANWPASRRAHWDALVRARSIENLCYVVAVNRVGTAGGLAYDGGSVAYGPWGELAASSRGAASLVATADVDPREVARVRGDFPFLCDK